MRRRLYNYEHLERRDTPAVWGTPWPEPERLTIGFVPDGALVSADLKSDLSESLERHLGRDQWQREILRAFQTWSQYADLNFSLARDDGSTLGGGAGPQGAAKEGDIRVGAARLGHSELAVASPFDMFSGWSGDVLLNSRYEFGSDSGFDLYTVALQEAGHALSLAGSSEQASAMHPVYQGPRSGLSAADVARLQSLYGMRTADRFEGSAGNDTFQTATRLQFVYDAEQLGGGDGSAGVQPFVAAADLTTASDVDVYRWTVPNDLHDFRLQLRTSGISLLTARMTVYDSRLRHVATTMSGDPRQGDLELFVGNARPGDVYYVAVEGASDDPFGIGAYRLAVGKEPHEALFPPRTGFLNDDRGDDDDDEAGSAIELSPQSATVDVRWDAAYRASVSFPGDVDVYRVQAPADAKTASTALVAAVWSMNPGELEPVIRVFAEGNSPHPLPFQTLRNDDQAMVIQVLGVAPGSFYTIEVAAADPQGSLKEGNYLVAADFRASPLLLDVFASRSLDQQTPQELYWLQNDRTQLHHFRLSAAESDPNVAVAVQMTIYDANREPLLSLVALAGEASTMTALLQPGRYLVRVVAATRDKQQPLPRIDFEIAGLVLSDPIGPIAVNPSSPPSNSPSWSYQYYYWQYFGRYASWLSAQDPYGDPFYKR